MCVAADGSLWTPVVRPVSVPVVSQRVSYPASNDVSSGRTVPHQMESRRANSLYSLPRDRNGPASSSTAPPSGRPRSVENIDLRQPPHLSPQQGLMQIPSQSLTVDRSARLKHPSDNYNQSLPRNMGHVMSSSGLGPAVDWSRQQHNNALLPPDHERSRSLSADRRRYFPPLQQDRRDERGRQLENTRREVRCVVTWLLELEL